MSSLSVTHALKIKTKHPCICEGDDKDRETGREAERNGASQPVLAVIKGNELLHSQVHSAHISQLHQLCMICVRLYQTAIAQDLKSLCTGVAMCPYGGVVGFMTTH